MTATEVETLLPSFLAFLLADAAPPGERFTTFYLFATALAAGIAATLPLVPVAFTGRRFFVLMSIIAIVFLALAIAVSGLSTSYWHLATAAFLIAYNVFLPAQAGVDGSVRRLGPAARSGRGWNWLARSMILLAAVSGLSGVVVDAWEHPVSLGFSGAQSVWLGISFVSSALLLGSAVTSMVLGHWYLVFHNPSFGPLARVTGVFLVSIFLRLVVVMLTLWAQASRWEDLLLDGVTRFLLGSGIFVLARWLFGLLAPLVLGWMSWRCVQLKSNQSATGILYVVLAFVLMGEIIAKYFLLSERIVL